MKGSSPSSSSTVLCARAINSSSARRPLCVFFRKPVEFKDNGLLGDFAPTPCFTSTGKLLHTPRENYDSVATRFSRRKAESFRRFIVNIHLGRRQAQILRADMGLKFPEELAFLSWPREATVANSLASFDRSLDRGGMTNVTECPQMCRTASMTMSTTCRASTVIVILDNNLN